MCVSMHTRTHIRTERANQHRLSAPKAPQSQRGLELIRVRYQQVFNVRAECEPLLPLHRDGFSWGFVVLSWEPTRLPLQVENLNNRGKGCPHRVTGLGGVEPSRDFCSTLFTPLVRHSLTCRLRLGFAEV